MISGWYLMSNDPELDDAASPHDAAAAVFSALSTERMSTYLVAANNDRDQALALYRWNTVLSGALYETLGIVEVVLRNAINDQFVHWCTQAHGHDRWFVAVTAPRIDRNGATIDPLLRDDQSVDKIQRAMHECATGRQIEASDLTPGMITSQLTFGFWTRLFHKDNTDVWPLFHRAFPHHPDGAKVNLRTLHRPLSQLGRIRNRVAHHEPLLRERIDRHHRTALELVRWVSPDAHYWLNQYCRVITTLQERPGPVPEGSL